MSLTQIAGKYIAAITQDSYHRFRSWDNCFSAFGKLVQPENFALELAFYLASWGMYRGSGGLLQKNHLVHQGAVEILLSESAQALRCTEEAEVEEHSISGVLALKEALAKYYGGISFTRGSRESKPISTTNTLLSKIMLGTLGCVPAYDRYFVAGLKEYGIRNTTFNKASLAELLSYTEEHKKELRDIQNRIFSQTGNHYPFMKILDMYFWQIGYDKEAGKGQEF